MTLRTQLWLTTLLPPVVCLILSYTLLLTSHRVREARESEQFANSVMQQMLELNRLTHAYLQRHGDPGRIRWQAKHQAFSKLLTAAKPLTMETRALIGKLRQNRQLLSHLTLQHALPASPFPSDLPEGSSSWQEGSSGQLHATLQAMLADANQLTRHIYQSLAVMQQQMQRLTLGLSIAIFSSIAWTCWSVGGHLVAALAQLREGTRRTASEFPSHRASIRTPGEIGPLVQALNQMTEWLQQSHITLQTEIVERQRAEKARQQREAELRLVLDTVPVMIAYCDRYQHYQFTNRTFEQWYGLSTAEAPKRQLRDIVGEAAYTLISPYIEQVLAGQEVVFEMRMPFQTSQERYVRGTYMPHRNDAGSVVGYIALMEDISDRKRLEEDLKQFQKIQSIGTLASGIAHEFNNILAAMLGYTELTQDNLPQQSPAWHNLQAVRTAGMRAKELVRQILAFSRQQPMERQPVPYEPLVQAELKTHDVKTPVPHGKGRILRVDDEARLTRVADSMLTRLGYEVEDETARTT